MSANQIDWKVYWKKFDDLSILDKKSDNIDSTLKEIEFGLKRKLLSGDHLLIISALEARIAELEQQYDPAS